MRHRVTLVVAALALAMPGCREAPTPTAAAADASSAPAAATDDAAATAAAPVRAFRSSRSYDPPPPPSVLRIPALGLDTTLEMLGRNPDGTVEVPSWNHPGWWSEGARPGQRGPAVILGHVDSRAGPAVFHRLHHLQPGDEVEVERSDGSVVRFAVDRLERHAKESFPTEAVYGASLEPGLRLITCGGVFDRGSGHYRDNVIVFARLVP